MKYVTIILFLMGSIAIAKPMALSGKLSDLTGSPIQSQNVIFKVSVGSVAGCVVYEEQFTQNMNGSNGFFKIPVGSGVAVFNGNGSPSSTYGAGSYLCKDGSQWVASNSDLRKIAVSVKIDQDPWVDFSADVINAVAYAESAERLNGYTSDSFIKAQGNVSQSSVEEMLSKKPQIDDLLENSAMGFVKSSDLNSALNTKQDKMTYTAMNPLQNLNDVQNKTQARTNLGLGALAILNQVSDANISSLQWSKILQKPTLFPPEDHSHSVAQIVGLNSLLNAKQNSSMMSSVRCLSSQTISFNALLDRFECQDINLTTRLGGASLSISSLAHNQGLFYDAPSSSWINKSPTLGGYPVAITAIKKNDIIKFNDVSQSWENSVPDNGTIIGSLITHTGRSCPANTLLADGRLVDKTTYAALYAAYLEGGTTPLYGQSGNNFRLPNYMGVFLRGASNSALRDPDYASRDMSATTTDSNSFKVGSYQADMFASHTHDAASGSGGLICGSGGSYALSPTTVTSTATGGNETRPKNISVLHCIYAGK